MNSPHRILNQLIYSVTVCHAPLKVNINVTNFHTCFGVSGVVQVVVCVYKVCNITKADNVSLILDLFCGSIVTDLAIMNVEK